MRTIERLLLPAVAFAVAAFGLPAAGFPQDESAGGAAAEASVETAGLEETAPAALTERQIYERFRAGVFQVVSQDAHGTGFLVSEGGLILTNHHVVAASGYLAVQYDERHKYEAALVAGDKRRDLAVLRVHPDTVRGRPALPLAGASCASIGDRVVTIGNPLGIEAILTAGIISKVDEETIYSDVSLNPGSSGGPLLDPRGRVVGVTTFGIQAEAGPGLSGIVRIGLAVPLIEEARAGLSGSEPPSDRLLPVEAAYRFPPDEVAGRVRSGAASPDRYSLEAGPLHVALYTPVAIAARALQPEIKACRGRDKRKADRAGGAECEPGPASEAWRRDADNFRPVVRIVAHPEVKMKAGSFFAALLLVPPKLKFKTDFQRMELWRDGALVEPILPGRIQEVLNNGSTTDVTYWGYYEYPPEAFRPGAAVTLRIWEEGKAAPTERIVDDLLLELISRDVASYLEWLDAQGA
jgi:hypothetical protein